MIEPINIDVATPETKALLEKLRRENSMLPNAFRVMAHAPAVLDGYVKLASSLRVGVLSARQREIIALRVATLNACEYCLAAHRVAARFAKLSQAEVQLAESGHLADQSDACLQDLVQAMVLNKGEVAPELLSYARQTGFTDQLLIEIAGQVALNTMTNTINRLARTPVDFGKTVRVATEVMVRLGIGTTA
jgi:uncharacterized peroxidase-related enzyme